MACPAELRASAAAGEAAASLQRACAGLDEDLMLAMLGTVQALAGTCSFVCAERMQRLYSEMAAAFEADLQQRTALPAPSGVAVGKVAAVAEATAPCTEYFEVSEAGGDDVQELELSGDGPGLEPDAGGGLEDMYEALSVVEAPPLSAGKSEPGPGIGLVGDGGLEDMWEALSDAEAPPLRAWRAAATTEEPCAAEDPPAAEEVEPAKEPLEAAADDEPSTAEEALPAAAEAAEAAELLPAAEPLPAVADDGQPPAGEPLEPPAAETASPLRELPEARMVEAAADDETAAAEELPLRAATDEQPQAEEPLAPPVAEAASGEEPSAAEAALLAAEPSEAGADEEQPAAEKPLEHPAAEAALPQAQRLSAAEALLAALNRRRATVDGDGETFESNPVAKVADAAATSSTAAPRAAAPSASRASRARSSTGRRLSGADFRAVIDQQRARVEGRLHFESPPEANRADCCTDAPSSKPATIEAPPAAVAGPPAEAQEERLPQPSAAAEVVAGDEPSTGEEALLAAEPLEAADDRQPAAEEPLAPHVAEVALPQAAAGDEPSAGAEALLASGPSEAADDRQPAAEEPFAPHVVEVALPQAAAGDEPSVGEDAFLAAEPLEAADDSQPAAEEPLAPHVAETALPQAAASDETPAAEAVLSAAEPSEAAAHDGQPAAEEPLEPHVAEAASPVDALLEAAAGDEPPAAEEAPLAAEPLEAAANDGQPAAEDLLEPHVAEAALPQAAAGDEPPAVEDALLAAEPLEAAANDGQPAAEELLEPHAAEAALPVDALLEAAAGDETPAAEAVLSAAQPSEAAVDGQPAAEELLEPRVAEAASPQEMTAPAAVWKSCWSPDYSRYYYYQVGTTDATWELPLGAVLEAGDPAAIAAKESSGAAGEEQPAAEAVVASDEAPAVDADPGKVATDPLAVEGAPGAEGPLEKAAEERRTAEPAPSAQEAWAADVSVEDKAADQLAAEGGLAAEEPLGAPAEERLASEPEARAADAAPAEVVAEVSELASACEEPPATQAEILETPLKATKCEKLEGSIEREWSRATTVPQSISFSESQPASELASAGSTPEHLWQGAGQSATPSAEQRGKWLAAELGIDSSDDTFFADNEVGLLEVRGDTDQDALSEDYENGFETDDFCTRASDGDAAACESFSKLVESLEPWGVVFANDEAELGVDGGIDLEGGVRPASALEQDSDGSSCATEELPEEIVYERGVAYEVRAPVSLRQEPMPEAPELARLEEGRTVRLFDWDSTRRWRRCWQAGAGLCGWLPLEGEDGAPLLWPEGLPEAATPLPPICLTIYENNLPHLRGFIADGFDLNAQDAAGRSPLALAEQLGRAECHALLLAAGAGVVEALEQPDDVSVSTAAE